MEEKFPRLTKKLKQPQHHLFLPFLSLENLPPFILPLLFYCFPKYYYNFRNIRYKNARQTGKKNRTDSSACVCLFRLREVSK